jgi:hypothetical protein
MAYGIFSERYRGKVKISPLIYSSFEDAVDAVKKENDSFKGTSRYRELITNGFRLDFIK